jgi:hypothetical protein
MRRWLLGLLATVVSVACAAPPADEAASDDALTSKDAQIVDDVFRGELIAGEEDDAKKAIVRQLFYVVGPLTTRVQANAQVGRVVLTDVTERIENGKKHVTYAARLPVAWPKASRVPASQDLVLPKDISAIDAFNAKYDGKCGVREASVELEALWYNFDPTAASCHLEEADIVRVSATTERNPAVTRGKYPQYDLVWSDGALDIVSVFNSTDGSGRREQYQHFVDSAKAALTGGTITDNAHGPSVLRDITISGKVRVQGQDRPVTFNALELGQLFEAGSDFTARYGALSENADLVTYVGHSHLGKNTRALSETSRAKAGKYQLFVFNSCDSFAYADRTLTERHAAANGPSDPNGTKFLDVMTNVLPSYVDDESTSLLVVVNALMQRDQPKTYDTILAGLPSDQMVVVWGEDDNTFMP